MATLAKLTRGHRFETNRSLTARRTPGFTCKGRLKMTGREAAAPRALCLVQAVVLRPGVWCDVSHALTLFFDPPIQKPTPDFRDLVGGSPRPSEDDDSLVADLAKVIGVRSSPKLIGRLSGA